MPSSKPIYKTAYSGREAAQTPTGRRMRDEYGYEIDSFGRKVLVKTGETDFYAKIQECLEDCKIENILARVAAGDNSVFRPDGIYADTTVMPNNMLEAMQQIQSLENTWASLDNEIKRKYNFDVGQFIGQSGSEEWLRDMGLLNEKTVEAVTEAVAEAGTEVKADE